jgi:glutaredoxin 3
MAILELYGASHCLFTADLREQLEWDGLTFIEYNVRTDAEAHARLVALTGEHLVPALVEDGRVVAVGWRGRGCTV